MIAQKVARLRRALWTWRQPLTRCPAQPAVPVSDLFAWRSSSEWQTSFELIDLSSLFVDNGDTSDLYVTIVFFDQNGRRFLEKRLDLLPYRRQTIDLSALVGKNHGELGTFAVFHSTTPSALTGMGSFVAERGYVSYCYRGAPLRAYVHGNLDAIALGLDGQVELLGASGLMLRQYRLQHEMQGSVLYELAMVNPTSVEQWCACQLVSTRNGKMLETQEINLAPGAVHLASFQIDKLEPVRVVIKSRLIMARPLVFRIQNLKLDVFHG
jgi:hypothetical protein